MFNKLFSNQKKYFSFWDQYPDLQQDLIDVHKIIIDKINPVQSNLGEALRYNFASPGKMLRPALILLFGQLGSQYPSKRSHLLNIAASTEMLHNATLIHDDIIDEATIRHGQESIYAKYGKHVAVYAGDYLFAVSLALLSSNTKIMDNVKADSKAMQDILVGETEQYNNTYNPNITIKQYLNQIKGKTAVLFGFSCFIGLFETTNKISLALKAKKFGELLGQTFQLKDDILDYTVSANQLKKPVLLDVKDGVYSGPLIFALQNDHTNILHDLINKGQNLTSVELVKIQHLVVELDGVKQAQALADKYNDQAIKILEKSFSNDETTNQIKQLTKKMLNRQY